MFQKMLLFDEFPQKLFLIDNNMKKITIVTTTIYPDLGGGELYMLNIAKEFSKNYKVDVICISNEVEIASKTELGIDFHYLPKIWFGGHYFPAFFATFKKLKEINPDIIYTSWPWISDFLIVFYNFFSRKKLIMTYHAMHNQESFILRTFTTIYLKMVLPFYDSIIVTTNKYFDILTKRWVKKLHLFPCGVESSKMNLDIQKNNSTKELLFVWVLDDNHRYKNLQVLIDAMIWLRDFHLNVVGDWELLEYFSDYAKSKNLENVTFLWKKQWNKLKELYSNANIFILPSNSSLEWFGIVLLEALWNLCKIITWEKAGWAFLIEENKNFWSLYDGSVEDLEEKIKTVYMMDSLKNEEIKIYLSQYNWENIAKNIINTIK